MMKWLLSTLLFGWPLAVYAASFDCAKAKSSTEKMICADRMLSKLDEDLAQGYAELLGTAVREEDKARFRQEQRSWVKSRDACQNTICLVQAYDERIAKLAADVIGLGAEPGTQTLEFALLRGKNVQVCEAYLERLNTSRYKAPPPCDRPETDQVPGFSALQRTELTKEEFNKLDREVFGFLADQNPSYWENMNRSNAERKLPPAFKDGYDRSQHQRDMPYWVRSADIDNDGTPDKVIIWNGSGECGGLYPAPTLQSRYAIIMARDGAGVDVERTRRLFVHPRAEDRIKQGLPSYWKGVSRSRWDNVVIGHQFGLFVYKRKTYVDTFLGLLGDLQGKTLPREGDFRSLSVLLHQNGHTEEVCRYRWNDPKGSIYYRPWQRPYMYQ